MEFSMASKLHRRAAAFATLVLATSGHPPADSQLIDALRAFGSRGLIAPAGNNNHNLNSNSNSSSSNSSSNNNIINNSNSNNDNSNSNSVSNSNSDNNNNNNNDSNSNSNSNTASSLVSASPASVANASSGVGLASSGSGRGSLADNRSAVVVSDGEVVKELLEPLRPSSEADAAEVGFAYHKELFPMDWQQDGMTILLASVGIVIAASGGIGGGGILVPLFMLVLKFKPKHAIALSNFTILGGAIANTMANCRKRHPTAPERPLIDWDMILAMEPLTIFGAVFGSLLSKILPNVVLTASLVTILAFMGHRTFKKGVGMWRDESRSFQSGGLTQQLEMISRSQDSPYLEFQSDSEGCGAQAAGSPVIGFKIFALTLCFLGTCILTVLKGGGQFPSPLGFDCGSAGFWALYFASVPWVLAFAIYFRYMLISDFERKVRSGHTFAPGEVQWNAQNTIKYPLLCAIAGLLAGLFGVGGGIVKGPLMLEMGIQPSVASASAAAMILYTAAAASTSFIVFGLLHPFYGAVFFLLGFVCTSVGQYVVSAWVKQHNRQSPIVLSIGAVILISSVLVAVNTVSIAAGRTFSDLMELHGVCGSAA